MNYITCDSVSFSYDRLPVIKNLSFSVNKGDFLCIVGENGTGKSTLVKGLLGLKKADSGSITFQNGLSNRGIGYLPQMSEQAKDFPASVQEVVRSGCLGKGGLSPFYSAEQLRNANAAMDKMGILSYARRNCAELSGGQKQRMLLARALCAASDLLLLDEPTAGLDESTTEELYNLIEKLHKEDGMTILMVTHDSAILPRLATHILHLGQTQTLFCTLSEYADHVQMNGQRGDRK